MGSNEIYTIGREFGSLGKQVGQELAKRLGIKFYDKELLQKAAKESGLCEEIFESHDEKPTNSFLYSLVMDTYTAEVLVGYHDIPDLYIIYKILVDILHAVCCKLLRIRRIQISCGNDYICIDIVSIFKYTTVCCFHCASSNLYITSFGPEILPVMALAAATAGLAR